MLSKPGKPEWFCNASNAEYCDKVEERLSKEAWEFHFKLGKFIVSASSLQGHGILESDGLFKAFRI
jgi:hypothetical protein